jgi:hypothetical protein
VWNWFRAALDFYLGSELPLMAEGLHFARLACAVGRKNAARYGTRRVTIGAVGRKDGERFVMGTFSDGTVVLGAPSDFTLPERKKARA